MLYRKTTQPGRRHAVGRCAAFILAALCIQNLAAEAVAQTDSPDDILVVANNSVSASSVSLTVIRDLFLKIRKEWRAGENATPVNAKDEQLRSDFRKRVLSMDLTAEQRHWEDVKVKFGQSEPPSFANNLKAVFKLKGAVSYLYRKDYKEGVAKVILVVPAKGN